MYKFRADHLVVLARSMKTLEDYVSMPPSRWNALADPEPEDHRPSSVKAFMVGLQKACVDAGLNLSAEMANDYIHSPPTSGPVMQQLQSLILKEMKLELYLRCPRERAKFFDSADLLSPEAREAFKNGPAKEITDAGTAYACGLFTACVFHSMRAVEDVVRQLATALTINISSHDDMKKAVDAIQKAARAIEAKPHYEGKKADSQFFSELSIQAGHFKDAWRNYVAHARTTYSENKALEVLNSTCHFLDKASGRFDGQGLRTLC